MDKFCFNVLESQYDLVKVLLKSLMVFLWQFFFLEMKQLELEVCDYKNLLSIIGTVCVCNVCVCYALLKLQYDLVKVEIMYFISIFFGNETLNLNII